MKDFRRKIQLLLAMAMAIVLVGGSAAVFHFLSRSPSPSPPPTPAPSGSSDQRISREQADELAALEAREQHVSETTWAKEMLAQRCGRTLEALWDSLNGASNKLAVVAEFPVPEVTLGDWNHAMALPHGMLLWEPTGATRTLAAEPWRRYLEDLDREGWRLEAVELRHAAFDTNPAGQPGESRYYAEAHLTQASPPRRAVVSGDLVVHWSVPATDSAAIGVEHIDASHLTIKSHPGEALFREIFHDSIQPPENAYSIDPLLLYDLDGDGTSEIILAGRNLVYRRDNEGSYRAAPLCKYPPRLISTAVIADFTGDGAADLLCARHEGLVLLPGSPAGTFDQPERMVFPAPPDLKYAMSLSCGDIDRDGDLDVFLAQYKVPYEFGAMPTPFHDANDGYPAYLLRNDGLGNLVDVTEACGLGAKRHRRTYSASLVDLDDDQCLDLAVVSDFAGVDLYHNDRRGHFTDVTSAWLAETHAFGMGHTCADFNRDGRLDLLVMGMTSATANRLDHLGLRRPGDGADPTLRQRMAHGNRLYLADTTEPGESVGGRAGVQPRAPTSTRFRECSLQTSIARSGWSWGCGAPDVDNDGFPDVYVANGLETRGTVRDYEAEYWLHDQYVAGSEPNATAYLYFMTKFSRTRGAGQSYGGHDFNRFFLNLDGKSFLEMGHLAGVAIQEDSRNVVADDLDGDGRMDLVVTSFEAWPQSKQSLRVFRSQLATSNHWIGFRFREEGRQASPVGVQVKLSFSGSRAVQALATGDSYRAQRANTLHFGLGQADRVERAEIRWSNGVDLDLERPAIDRHHDIRLPR